MKIVGFNLNKKIPLHQKALDISSSIGTHTTGHYDANWSSERRANVDSVYIPITPRRPDVFHVQGVATRRVVVIAVLRAD